MKTFAAKTVSNNTLTSSPIGLNAAPILNKKSLAAFPTRHPLIQAKLKIGQPNDKYEQEADRVADRVISMPEPKQSSVNGHWSSGKDASGNPLIQRQSDECPECNEKEEDEAVQTKPISEQITQLVQRQVDSEEEPEKEEEEEEEPVQAKHVSNKSPTMAPGLQGQIQAMRGGGQPLSRSTRSFFEPRFGRDFGGVRVHTGAKAAEAAKAMNAKAFTFGRDMVFSSGQYSPNTIHGKQLLAHELVHVTQQRPAVMRSETPVPVLPTAPVQTCTVLPDWEKVKEITRARMKHKVEKSGILDPKATRATQPLILMADKAIRDQFGSYIPGDRKFGSEKSVTIRTVDQITRQAQTSGDNSPFATAVREVATEVLEEQKEHSSQLCLPEPTAVNSHVVEPILKEPGSGSEPSGVELAKNYAVARMPAKTKPIGKEAKTLVVSQFAFIGHILVHEAMHFYTHPNFEKAAKCADLQKTLMEGAAELFARQVIKNKLQADHRFNINTGTYVSELNYVVRNIILPGLPAAFFLGNTAAIGFNPTGQCKPEGPRSPKKGSPIDVDVLGIETKTGKDANIARAAAAQEGIDIVVESLEDMIEKLDDMVSGEKCIHCLSVFNHGAPGRQLVSTRKGKEEQKSGFFKEWLESPGNTRNIGILRSVFCANGFMRWLGCATAGVKAGGGVRTDEEIKSERYRGRRFIQSWYQSEEEAALHGASTKVRGLEVLQLWADEVGVPIIAATDLARMNEKGIVVKYGGSWLTVHPRK